MSQEGVRKIRIRFVYELKAAVRDGVIEPHEAAVVLASTLAMMVAAIRDDGKRAEYMRDLAEGFPAAVTIERAGVDGMVRQ